MTLFGWGVFKGMMVTLKNFLTSYYRKPDEGGIFTVQYPEEREKEIENYRNFETRLDFSSQRIAFKTFQV